MNYVDSFNLFGTEAAQIPCIKGTGAPTATTEGAVGCFYMNTDNGDVYKCTAVVDGAYTWVIDGANVSPEQITDAVNAYLEENPVQAVEVDTTLTVPGAAADAKAVGDILANLSVGGYKLIETITLEEETTAVVVDFDKKYKSLRVRIAFPSATTEVGYVYSRTKLDGLQNPVNMCGFNMLLGDMYVEHIRIASEVSPFAWFSASSYGGNENAQTMRVCFPDTARVMSNEKDGFKGIVLSIYNTTFPVGTVIHIMEG